MSETFFISDTHWGHANILKFTKSDGTPIRPGFSSIEEMNETLIRNWNDTVKETDIIWHLGDVAFGTDTLSKVMPRLRGRKFLILGNHDDATECVKYFQKIQIWRVFKEHNFVATHLPIHESSLFKVEFNCHGHTHEKPNVSNRHLNLSVERTNYRPIHVDEVLKRLKEL